MNLATQGFTLLMMLLSGGILGIAFDSYRIVSGRLHFPKWSVHGLDLLYWIAASLFVFRMLQHSNEGELRFYVFLGLFLGVWTYFLFLSVITERFVVMLMLVASRIYTAVVRIIQALIIKPIGLLIRALKLLLGFLWIGLLFILRTLFLPVWKLMVWATAPLMRRFRILDRLQSLRLKYSALRDRWFPRK